jgi:TetR/AcrR family transcriptional regulator
MSIDGAGSITTSDKIETNPVARHIARVAARLFAAQGYDATSVREIVEGAGVAKPTLYYYYRSKEGLAKALISVPLSNLVDKIHEIVVTEKDPVHCLERILEAHFAFCREDPDRSRFLYAIFFGPPGSGSAMELDCCKEDLSKWIEAAIRRLVEAGIIRRERLDACMTMCRGQIVISTLGFLYEDKPLGQDLARVLVNDLLQGFDARRSPRDPE